MRTTVPDGARQATRPVASTSSYWSSCWVTSWAAAASAVYHRRNGSARLSRAAQACHSGSQALEGAPHVRRLVAGEHLGRHALAAVGLLHDHPGRALLLEHGRRARTSRATTPCRSSWSARPAARAAPRPAGAEPRAARRPGRRRRRRSPRTGRRSSHSTVSYSSTSVIRRRRASATSRRNSTRLLVVAMSSRSWDRVDAIVLLPRDAPGPRAAGASTRGLSTVARRADRST